MGILLLTIVLIGLCLIAWRFFGIRSKGYPVVIRRLPAAEGRHWRHGVLLYSATSARFFKLRSVRPEPDLVFTRLATRIESRREMSGREAQFMENDLHIVHITHRDQQFELAVDSRGDTALVSWLESAPSERRVRYE